MAIDTPPGADGTMTEPTVLIIDDEPAIRDMIATAFEVAGFECLQADNARDGHALIIDRKPDLVLLDWMMPVTSGIELLRRLRRDELTYKISVIMLTAKADEDNLVQGLEWGVDDYIPMRFSPRELIARAKSVLRSKQTPMPEEMISALDLVFEPVRNIVTTGRQLVVMGQTEFRL